MAVRLNISLDDLFKLSRTFEKGKAQSKQTMVNALNELGNSVLRQMRIDIQNRTGLPIGEIDRLLAITPATMEDPAWGVDTSLIWSSGFEDPYKLSLSHTERERLKDILISRYRVKQQGRKLFSTGQLVKILTAEDERVCDICQDAADAGPYTIEEAQRMIPFHPNCRCSVMPFSMRYRAPVTYTTPVGPAPRGVAERQMTPREMAQFLSSAVKSSIRAKK